jgi:hypothetical protein
LKPYPNKSGFEHSETSAHTSTNLQSENGNTTKTHKVVQTK